MSGLGGTASHWVTLVTSTWLLPLPVSRLPPHPPHCHAFTSVSSWLTPPCRPLSERPSQRPHSPLCAHEPFVESASPIPDPDRMRNGGVLVTLRGAEVPAPAPPPHRRARRHTHETPHPLRIGCPQLSKTHIYSSAPGPLLGLGGGAGEGRRRGPWEGAGEGCPVQGGKRSA